MNQFQLSSIRAKELMNNLLNSKGIPNHDIAFTDEKGYDKYDGTFKNSKGQTIMFEIKVRNVPSTQYPTTVIEKGKYDFLINQHNASGVIPYLFVFFTDGKVLIQNLLSKSVIPTRMFAPKTTAGNNEKVIKNFVEFPIDCSNTHNI